MAVRKERGLRAGEEERRFSFLSSGVGVSAVIVPIELLEREAVSCSFIVFGGMA